MTSFEDRKKNLFNTLCAAESRENFATKRKQFTPKFDSDTDKVNLKKLKTETRHLRGKESIFKRPEIPLSGCLKRSTIPSHRKYPSKWTYYNLEDVPDVTDRSNAEAAAICMAECRKDKREPEVKADLNNKLLFKLPVKDAKSNIIKISEEPEDYKTFKGTKMVLPQYFVGQKKEKKKSNKSSTMIPSEKQLKLAHLDEKEDEDDNDDDDAMEE